MRFSCFFTFVLTVLASIAFQPLSAQMGFNLEVKKPKPYEERVLKAEKSPTDKKIKPVKRFFQNLTTHYNYFFNANNKLNSVIEQAKAGHRDDYSKLLPFYNYTLDGTAASEMELDSVIYKARTGIVVHDLRSDWVDNLYLLWGAAHYFQKEFDSASLMFQFINYAFADKEKDGYYKYIGSRLDGNSASSISTKENNSLTKRVFSTSPSRNDALMWQIRTLMEMDNLTEAGSLIVTLKNDPNFPERLKNELEEVQAYWFYKQGIWDSSATHLINALDVAQNKQEKGRWEFLAAQMFEKAGKSEEAQNWYTKSIGHGTDPVMDVYARLNLVHSNKSGGDNYIDQNVAELVKMAKKEKYEEYRDVIYFMAAQMEMERNNPAAAQEFLLKASKHNNNNLSSHSEIFLMIADLFYQQKKYVQAASFYDSIQINELKEDQVNKVEQRKASLVKIVASSSVIERQDSLQRIAAMPEEERKAYITKLVKKLRKQQGLGDENSPSSGSASPFLSSAPSDLFEKENKGEWYFYNSSLKTSGGAQFKQIWGNRPNADNWRRFSQVSMQLVSKTPTNNNPQLPGGTINAPQTDNTPSYTTLVNRLPLTPETRQASDDSINNALFSLGSVFINELEDYSSTIDAFEKLRTRVPNYSKMDEVLFGLYYAYTKTGNTARAAEIKSLLAKNYASSRFTSIVTTGTDPSTSTHNSSQATKDYEAIYDMFIEGRFGEAEAAKKKADSTYQTNHWQPQLLYIEAVYQIRQRNDSNAKNILNTLIAQDPASPMAKKAQTMVDVLNRRAQIEDELNRWQIQRPAEDTVKAAPVKTTPPPTTPLVTTPPVTKPPVITPPVEQPIIGPTVQRDNNISKTTSDVAINTTPKRPLDTMSKRAIVGEQKTNTVYKFEPSLKHYAVIILDKVDAIFSGETKNAFTRFNKEKYYTLPLAINTIDLDSVHKLVLIGDFNSAQEALDYVQQAKRLAPNEIIPWLKPDKYSFSILSPGNLEVLQNLKDLSQYRKFLEQNLPGKF